MKKLFLLASLGVLSADAMAQNRTASHTGKIAVEKAGLMVTDAAAKTTATDTIQGLLNFPAAYLDSLTLYRAGSSAANYGYVVGTNSYGDKGFAERFDFRTGDTSAKVIGVITFFGGTYSPNTTKTINLRVWSQGPRTAFSTLPKVFYSGLPSTVLATQVVSIKNLGINIGTGNDSLKRTNFSTPMAALSDTFFVGYDVNYSPAALAGDTIGLYSTIDLDRFAPLAYLSGTDTIVNVKNASQFDDNVWHDNALENFELAHHLAIFPVVVREYNPSSVEAINKNGLAWYGHYPNPATNMMNVRLALKDASDVTVTIMSMDGRILSSTQNKLGAGEHILPVATDKLPAGTYTYLVRTSSTQGIASQFTVVR